MQCDTDCTISSPAVITLFAISEHKVGEVCKVAESLGEGLLLFVRERGSGVCTVQKMRVVYSYF